MEEHLERLFFEEEQRFPLRQKARKDLHSNLHQKVDVNNTVTTYNYSMTETAPIEGWRKYDRRK